MYEQISMAIVRSDSILAGIYCKRCFYIFIQKVSFNGFTFDKCNLIL